MRLFVVFVGIIVIIMICVIYLAVGVFLVRALYNIGDRYLPKTRILASTDGGKSYTEYVSCIPVAADVFFIKYEVAIKASGLRRLIWGNEIPFMLAYPDYFQFEHEQADEVINYTCELTGYSNCVPTTDYNATKKQQDFLTLAAKKPQKAEITLRVSKQKKGTSRTNGADDTGSTDNPITPNSPSDTSNTNDTSNPNSQSKNTAPHDEFAIWFDQKVHPAYRKRIELDFTDYAGNVIVRDTQ